MYLKLNFKFYSVDKLKLLIYSANSTKTTSAIYFLKIVSSYL